MAGRISTPVNELFVRLFVGVIGILVYIPQEISLIIK